MCRSTAARLVFSMVLVAFHGAAVLAGTGIAARDADSTTLDFCVSVRFEATDEQLARIEQVLGEAGQLLYMATDGRLRFGTIAVENDATAGAAADVWIRPGRGPSYTFGAFGDAGEHVVLYYESDIDSADGARVANLIFQRFRESATTGPQNLAIDLDREYAGTTDSTDTRLIALDDERRIVVAVDRSESMAELDVGVPRSEVAVQAAGLLLDLLGPEASGSVLAAGDRVDTIVAWGSLGANGRGLLDPVRVDFAPTGRGRLGAVVLRAKDELDSRPRSFDQTLVLFTDGFGGRLADPTVVARRLGAWTPVTTVLVNDVTPSAGLAEIAAATGGDYWLVESPKEAAATLPFLYARLSGRDVLAATEVTSETGNEIQLPVDVDLGTNELTIVLGGPPSAIAHGITLVSPPADSTLTRRRVVGPGYEIVRVRPRSGSLEGRWIIGAAHDESEPHELHLTVIGGATETTLTVATDRAAYRRGETIGVRATPQHRGRPITGVRVTANVRGPGGTVRALALVDDGAHGDRLADDGVYGARFNAGDDSATYVFDITARGAGGKTYGGDTTLTDGAAPPPDVVPVPDFTRMARVLAIAGGGVPGDCDGDADIDIGDYENFVACFGSTLPTCSCSDLDADTDIDCADWGLLRAGWNGEGARPMFTSCDAGTVAPSLRLAKGTAGPGVDLSWSPSCAQNTVDYAVYEGTVGTWDIHNPVTCSTAGLQSWSVPAAPGDRYYIVTSHNVVEGSYGKRLEAMALSERPVGTPACLTPQVSGCEGDCRIDRCSGHGECVDDGTGTVLGCDCDFGFTGDSCRDCYPAFTGTACDTCAVNYVDHRGQCDGCAPGFHAEHRLLGAGLLDDPNYESGPARFFHEDLYCVPNETCADVDCSPIGGTCIEDDNVARCVCNEGWAGVACDECAVLYDPGPVGGSCVLGQTCRDAFCFGNGNCELDPLDNLVCNCDAGFGGDDCGGPSIIVQGTDLSIGQGEQVTLSATGGSGSYMWTLDSGPGSLFPTTLSPNVTYTADFVSPDVEIPLIRATDPVGGDIILTSVTVIPSDCVSISGTGRPELVWFDRMMCRFMKSRGIRAGTLAVAKNGERIYSRGYGYMDDGLDADPWVHYSDPPGPVVPPDALMRLASVTKPLTAAAVTEAAADGGFGLNEPALSFVEIAMGSPWPFSGGPDPIFVETQGIPAAITNQCPDWPGSMPDSRWWDITVDHLIRHRSGHARDADGKTAPGPRSRRWTDGFGEEFYFTPPGFPMDESYCADCPGPMAKGVMMIHDMELALPGNHVIDGPVYPDKAIQYMAGHCLLFDPGTDDYYANFNYVLLGRVLEGMKGQLFQPEQVGNDFRPLGFGPFIDLLRDFLDDWGVSDIYGGAPDLGDALGREPYYRHLDADGTEKTGFNISEPFHLNENIDTMIFDALSAPTTYGASPMSIWDSAGGVVASAPAILHFMKYFWLSDKDGESDYGKRIVNREQSWARHHGLRSGTRTLAWQMGKSGGCHDGDIGDFCLFDDDCSAQNICLIEALECRRPTCVVKEDCMDVEGYPYCLGNCDAQSANTGESCATNAECMGGTCEGKICNKYKAGCTLPPDNSASMQWTKLVLPSPVQMWNQEDVGKAVLDDDPFFCLYESKTDMVVLFNQSRDGKDTAQDQYGKITDFLKRAACSVTDWPEPLPPCPNPPCYGWVKP